MATNEEEKEDQGRTESALGEPDHLSGDADATLIEDLDRDLVALTDLTDDVGTGDDDVVKVERARRGRLDAELFRE